MPNPKVLRLALLLALYATLLFVYHHMSPLLEICRVHVNFFPSIDTSPSFPVPSIAANSFWTGYAGILMAGHV